MPITASYSSATRKLTALGTSSSESIVISRDAAGGLLINGGAIVITGGPATVVNTDLIEAFGLDLNDVITIDETNGAMPAANLTGGNGNDTLTGGSNGDTLNGDAGIDTLLGRGGIDQLFGGNDGDVLTGGDGNDTMSGEAGNDRMIWNPGDDSDVMEGGADSDIAEVNGGNGTETFSIAPTAGGTRVLLQSTGPAPFTIDIGTTESLVLNANGGDDVINATGNLAALIALTIDGGAGNDTINGDNGTDTLLGGDGDDVVDGNQGADVALLGAGDDVFHWDPGDGSDTVEGQADADTLDFNGSNASENIDISPNGGRVRFFRDVAAITMDLNDVETITYNALGGADDVAVADMTGTDLTRVNVNLANSGGLVDGSLDSVRINGSAGDDSITASLNAGSVDVSGLTALVHISTAEATDKLVVSAGSGDDVIDASGLPAATMAVDLQGGLGADVFLGSAGNDLITGGDGDDVALMGAGIDTFVWNPGDDNDTIEGQAGTDTLDFNGAAVAEQITINANGGRTRLFRDIGAVTMDLNDVETINFDAGGAADSIAVTNLTGTDVTQIIVNLAGTIGGSVGDGAVDAISVAATDAANTIVLSGNGGAYTVTGLPYVLAVNQSEAADTLIVAAGLGADTISAAGLAAGNTALTLRGEGGNDIVTGSAGADLLFGGTENDTLTGGPGADQMSGEDGNDVMIWNPGDGSDVMEGGLGSDTAQVNGDTGDEVFTIADNGARVAFNRVSPGPFVLDIGTTENLLLNAGGGNDTISASGNLAALIAMTLDGGGGNDTILAGNGIDQILGGDGNDFVDGNQGNDVAFLGTGDDIFQWDPGDQNDTVEGQAGVDTLLFNGNGANEIINVAPNGARAQVNRDVGAIILDLNGIEKFTINAGAGTDSIFVGNLAGTGATDVTINLAGTIGGSTGDAQIDTVNVAGTGGADSVDMLGIGSFYSVLGLSALVAVNQSEATDQVIIRGLGGDDSLSAAALPAGVTGITLDGGADNDSLSGSAGADTLLGGDGNDLVDGNQGNDTAFLGIGDDAFKWDPGDGSDVVEGQAGADELRFNGSNASEIVGISANGGRALFARDIGAITMDMDDVETITFKALGGADNIVVGNLAGTDVGRIVIDLAAFGGGGDGSIDTVTLNGTGGADNVTFTIAPSGAIIVNGLAAVVEIRNFEAGDKLVILGGLGDDVIDGSALDISVAFVADGGDGDDQLTGTDGDDILIGGLGTDTMFNTLGRDYFDGGDGAMIITG